MSILSGNHDACLIAMFWYELWYYKLNKLITMLIGWIVHLCDDIKVGWFVKLCFES